MRESFARRIRVLSIFVLVIVAVVIGRLYAVQVVSGEAYDLKADRQYVEPQEGIFDRGNIFFSDKDGNRIPAAVLSSGFFLALNPQKMTDVETAYTKLSNVIDLEREVFFEHADRTDDPYEVVAHHLTRSEADAINALSLDGVTLYPEQWRYYPGEERAAHVIGFLAYDENELAGRYGLERQYETVLARDTQDQYINFFAEAFANVAGLFDSNGGRGNGDLVLTLEPSVQATLEEELFATVDRYGARSAGGLVMDPMDGTIYAMASYPTFDVNNFREVEDPSIFTNPFVQDVYEMGSIIKTLTMAAGLDVGVVTPNTTYYDAGFLELDGGRERIENYDGEGRGTVDMTRVLGESLNTGAAFVANQMGNKAFADYLIAYGLGEETSIDLPGEVEGLLGNLDSPRDVEYATAAFGQGIALSPIATARAMATLANGGYLVTPHVVKEIDYEVLPTETKTYERGEQVLATSTSETITRMLVDVVDDYLAGGTVDLARYSIAAKTGTAQIPSPNGGYLDNEYFHSFFGYFPAYNPRFLVLLFIERPQGVRYASETLTTPFMNLATSLLTYYDVPPDR